VSEQQRLNNDPPTGTGGPPASGSDNLAHLLPPSTLETPFYKSLYNSIKELINPPKLPPLVLTSKPLSRRKCGPNCTAGRAVTICP
jgi:hypothetical protein